MMLEVGASVMKNQMKPMATQRFLPLVTTKKIPIITNPAKNMKGSDAGVLNGRPLSTFRLKGNRNSLR